MKNEPLVTVIMPAYNAEKTIAESIESVLHQSYKKWELLIINDGSKDNTTSTINNYQDKRIKLLEQKNSGVACARNRGLLNAAGEYITFLDSDDLWATDKLKKQVDFFQSNKHAGLVYTERKCFYNDHLITLDCEYSEPAYFEDDYLRLLTHDYIPTLTVMIKKEILNKIGFFDESLFGAEDWDLWIRIAEHNKVNKIPEKLAYYREHPKGISKDRDKHSKEEWKVIKKHVIGNSNISSKVTNLCLWIWYKKKLLNHIKKKDISLSFKIYYSMITRMGVIFTNKHLISHAYKATCKYSKKTLI